jgi:hypothetical protein
MGDKKMQNSELYCSKNVQNLIVFYFKITYVPTLILVKSEY